jgi:hypothetical protein
MVRSSYLHIYFLFWSFSTHPTHPIPQTLAPQGIKLGGMLKNGHPPKLTHPTQLQQGKIYGLYDGRLYKNRFSCKGLHKDLRK